jgi:hypothetical protein
MNRLVRFHAWESEAALRAMKKNSKRFDCNIETFTTIVDAAGWTTRLATSDAFTFIKGMAKVDSDHYPERLGSLLIINAPTALSWAYNIIKPFLDEVTKAKIQIMSNRNQWEPALFNLIDRNQVPMQYGGTAPDLTPEEALASLDPPVGDRMMRNNEENNEDNNESPSPSTHELYSSEMCDEMISQLVDMNIELNKQEDETSPTDDENIKIITPPTS